MAHHQEVVSSNPGTVYWMDVSDDAIYYIKEKLKIDFFFFFFLEDHRCLRKLVEVNKFDESEKCDFNFINFVNCSG
jgi:hypothetical protein